MTLAVLTGWWWMGRGGGPVVGAMVASVELVEGAVWSGKEALVAGTEIYQGAELSTSAPAGRGGRAALRMATGQSLRVGTDTAIRFDSDGRLELIHGTVYIDSPPSPQVDRHIDVVTPLGTVMEIGTQFEVRYDDLAGELGVRVREGAVSVRRREQAVTARRGEALTVRRDGSVSRSEIATGAAEWQWVLETAPTIAIEGVTLDAFLEWASREAGLEVEYGSPETRNDAAGIVLHETHGALEGLRPDQLIDPILRGSGLASEVEADHLVVSRPR